MRLLNACSGEITIFQSSNSLPPYAILSHTWNEEEVSFQDWEEQPWEEVKKKKGFKKIEYCRQQAIKEGLGWVWVDTCCINKQSSAELSEDINSMFKWYKQAAICYAYLADVEEGPQSIIESRLRESRWFTRGWTLQELIAPEQVVFYSQNWHEIGTKSTLSKCLSRITNIGEMYLMDSANIRNASIAQRMSWAAYRVTTREEDIAYCLIGIFDVNIPLLYGEGKRAFRRLQEEVLKAYPEDHTLFAWGTIVSKFSKYTVTDAQMLGYEPIEGNLNEDGIEGDDNDDESVLGLLAQSPADFKDSGRFVQPINYWTFFRPRYSQSGPLDILMVPTVFGSAIYIELPIVGYLDPKLSNCAFKDGLPLWRLRETRIAILTCGYQDWNDFRLVTIPLIVGVRGSYGRTREIVINSDTTLEKINYSTLRRYCQKVIIEDEPSYQPQSGDIVFRRITYSLDFEGIRAAKGVDILQHNSILRSMHPTQHNIAALLFKYDLLTGLGICIRRVGQSENGIGNLEFAVMHINYFSYADKYVVAGNGSQDKIEGSAIEGPPPFKNTHDAWDYLFSNWNSARWEGVVDSRKPLEIIAESEFLPRVRIATERIPIDEDSEQYVDMVDIIIQPKLNQPRYITPSEGMEAYLEERKAKYYLNWKEYVASVTR
ncbi:HET-domain-containing protein [Daldinia sp. FL1419]|nr:HET-domain-containing protein [Daldinia sp. FL1419]